MDIELFDDAERFLATVGSFLLAEEAVNNLIIGVANSAVREPEHFDEFVGWLVHSEQGIAAVAAQTPPHNLILATPANDEAVRLLASSFVDLPGVIGTKPAADTFAEERSHASRTMRQGIYQLTTVEIPTEAGHRRTTPDDRQFLIKWILEFLDEATPTRPDRTQAERVLDRRLSADETNAGLWVLEVGGDPVSISGYANPTPNGIRIGPVYTPPQHRGRGYATRLVAAQSQWLLDRGYQFVFLYTDLDNATANSIYRSIGFQMVAESVEYSFSPSV